MTLLRLMFSTPAQTKILAGCNSHKPNKSSSIVLHSHERRTQVPGVQRIQLEHSVNQTQCAFFSTGGKDNSCFAENGIKLGTIVVGAIVPLLGAYKYFDVGRLEKKEKNVKSQIDFVQDQIKTLYGPLYGNRVEHKTTFEGAEGDFKTLSEYLEHAREQDNKQMIAVWRKFVWDILFPLDEKARELICQNTHLIEGDFPEEFCNFLRHYGKLRFVVSRWKDEGGKLKKANGDFLEEDFLERNNASGESGLDAVLEHARLQLQKLIKKQETLNDMLNKKTND